ncbi:hypothetical protein EVAR_31583_1 [Eumeta japonica]|uniref:Uncharacterized protein n=1 Tax=Eumeta variegata TaxID=151549 RepID=A0A4C1V7C2_EUMVA|nr:hypothetical protein EVAR_31583_1 [Eumeta japonica]
MTALSYAAVPPIFHAHFQLYLRTLHGRLAHALMAVKTTGGCRCRVTRYRRSAPAGRARGRVRRPIGRPVDFSIGLPFSDCTPSTLIKLVH